MRSVLSVRSSCRVVATALLVVAAPLTLHIYSAQAQVEAVEARRERLAAQEAAQRVREEEARRLGESIVELREALTGRAFDPGFRETVKRNLLGVPIDTLRDVERNGAQGDLRAAISPSGETDSTSAGADEDLLLLPTRVAEPNAVSGVATSGAVFVPITPCRIIDTRSAGGPLFPGVPRSFVVSGSNPALFGAQGGNPSGCGIPVGTAVAAFVNFVAASPAGAGNLRAWAYAASLPPAPFASILNYAAVLGNIANGVTTPLCDPLATTCTYDVLAQAFASSTDVVADVLGYFGPAPTSFVATTRSGYTTTIGSSCTQYAGAVIGINAPAPGKVLVRANVQLRVNHTVGASDFVYVYVGAGPTDCSSPLGDSTYVTMNPEPTGFYYPTVPISRLFTVSTPGTYFYYVNGIASSSFDDSFWFAGVQATYYPN